jgi:uncharacterized protein (DUF2384 family)
MARTGYSTPVSGETVARGKANELPISPKHAMEIARFIRNKKTGEAVAYLEEVISAKKAIPFRKYNRKVAHKRGLSGWDAGRSIRLPRTQNISALIPGTCGSSTPLPTGEGALRGCSREPWAGQRPSAGRP